MGETVQPTYMRIASEPIGDGEVARTIQAGEAVMVDVAADGRVLGIECLAGPVGISALYLALRSVRVQAATPDGPRRWALPDDREQAKTAIHRPLHDLNVRIVGLPVGDCHCNLIAEVVLDTLTDATPAADGQDGRDG